MNITIAHKVMTKIVCFNLLILGGYIVNILVTCVKFDEIIHSSNMCKTFLTVILSQNKKLTYCSFRLHSAVENKFMHPHHHHHPQQFTVHINTTFILIHPDWKTINSH